MSIDAVPSLPIREWLIAWTVMTGDPPETIAQGFGLDLDLVAELLGIDPPRILPIEVARLVCTRLRADPAELWRPEIAGKLRVCHWPVEPHSGWSRQRSLAR